MVKNIARSTGAQGQVGIAAAVPLEPRTTDDVRKMKFKYIGLKYVKRVESYRNELRR